MAYFKYNRFWDNGLLKWIKSTVTQAPANHDISYDNILLENLSGCDIKSDIVDVSWMISKNNITLKHFLVSSTVSWEWIENTLIIHTEDEVSFKLLFYSIAEASKANYRLYLIMNGNRIVGCNDDTIFYCGKPNQIQITFNQ